MGRVRELLIMVALTCLTALAAGSAATAAAPRYQGYVRGAVTGQGHVGSYIVKWIVNDRVVAHWRFFN